MNQSAPYWQRYPLSRRRLLALGGSGLAGLSLSVLACSDDGSSEPAPALGRISVPNNTTAVAKPGGAFKTFTVLEPQGLDPMTSVSPATLQMASLTYPRLLKFTPALYPDAATGAVEGDLAESWEFLPDRLTLTFRLRPGLRWDAKLPTNGRIIDATDVVASWNRFARLSPARYDLLYHADLGPASPVESVSSPNATTVVFKLRYPDVSVLELFASGRHFFVMPKEADVTFDPRVEMRGYGPWLLTENRPGIVRNWTRNKDYYVRERPFPDTMEQFTIGEYNARLAQFKAGLIWPSVVTQDDLLPTMSELPDLLVQRSDSFAAAPPMLGFGYDPAGPWKDERLRQAVSMLIDREAFTGLRSNRDTFESAGLPVEVRYHSVVGAGWDGYWVDPRDSRFGQESRFFRLDPQGALQLMSAAGFADGLDTLLHYSGGMDYSASYTRNVEMVSAMLFAGGVRARLDPRSHSDDWLPNFQTVHAQAANVGKPPRSFPGIVLRPVSLQPNAPLQLFSTFHRSGAAFHGMTPDGKNPHLGDTEVNTMLESMRRDGDLARRRRLALDFARLMARRSYDIPVLPFAASPYTLTWPVVGNQGVYRGWPGGAAATETAIHTWIDASQAPLRAGSVPGGTP